jgi:hypothetical protein
MALKPKSRIWYTMYYSSLMMDNVRVEKKRLPYEMKMRKELMLRMLYKWRKKKAPL